MSMEPIYRALIPTIWAIWCVYWFIAARGAKATVRVESAASLASHAVPLAFAGWLITTNRPLGILGETILPPGPWTYIGGVAVLIAGLAFSVWARRWLGRNWSGVVTLKQDHELIRGGPYRHVRHPIYSGILLAFAGCALARDEWRGVLALAIGWFALWCKLKLEERWLIEQFGAAYLRYRAEVPALIPHPFRSAQAQSP
jgi:protein-S-isoprenylcysteine O-methyltransferase Ste14